MTFKIGKYYNIITKYPNVLGSQLNNLRCVGILPYDKAINIINLVQQHNDILKTTTVSDTINSLNYKNFEYVHFQDENNVNYVLTAEYIFSMVESGDEFKFKVSNISPTDKNVIKAVLLQHGYILEEIV